MAAKQYPPTKTRPKPFTKGNIFTKKTSNLCKIFTQKKQHLCNIFIKENITSLQNIYKRKRDIFAKYLSKKSYYFCKIFTSYYKTGQDQIETSLKLYRRLNWFGLITYKQKS